MKNGNKKYLANPWVVLREEFDDWAVLFNPDTGHGYGLSPTGVYLWKFLDGEHSIDDMVTALRRDADGVPDDASEQIVAFVEELTEQGLAGSDTRQANDDRRRISSCPACAGTIKFTYERPMLVDLSGQQAAHGADCSQTGTNATTGHCGSFGGHASTGCGSGTDYAGVCLNGPCAGNGCNHGAGALVTCGNGTYYNSYCLAGCNVLF